MKAISAWPAIGSNTYSSFGLCDKKSVFLPCGSGGLLFGIDGEPKQADDVNHGLFQVLPKAV